MTQTGLFLPEFNKKKQNKKESTIIAITFRLSYGLLKPAPTFLPHYSGIKSLKSMQRKEKKFFFFVIAQHCEIVHPYITVVQLRVSNNQIKEYKHCVFGAHNKKKF